MEQRPAQKALQRLFVPALLLAFLTLSPLVRAAPTQPLAVLIVSNLTSFEQRMKEEQMIAFIRHGLEEQGLAPDVLPILTYHMDKPTERAYCEASLGIRMKDLVFVGLAQHRDRVVKAVIVREPNVTDPEEAANRLLDRVVVAITGQPRRKPTPTPTYSPTPTPEPVYTPSATRVRRAISCRSTTRDEQDPTPVTAFEPDEALNVQVVVNNVRRSQTVVEVRWYRDNTPEGTSRKLATLNGGVNFWFWKDAPAAGWSTSSWRAEVYVNGRLDTTLRFTTSGRSTTTVDGSKCRLSIVNETSHSVRIYLDGRFAGTIGARETRWTDAPRGSVRVSGSCTCHSPPRTWGPRTYTFKATFKWTLQP